ncbi:hypothetical protein HG530_014348 [Fusarium avenaceum]|nr:hypothetical protein HG530_014348 [Fusarium avenaceum]
MTQLLDMPNEILDLIFENTSLEEIWNFQQCNILCERALDPRMLARHDAVAELMLWGCQKGIPWAIKKAVSHGANIDVTRDPYFKGRRRYFTIAAARGNLDTIGLLLDLGARLDLEEDRARRILRKYIFDSFRPKILQVVLDHGGKDQIEDFQTGLDQCLYDALSPGFRVMERGPEGWRERQPVRRPVIRVEGVYENCKAWLAYGANPARLLENHTETAIERAISNLKAGWDPGMTIALINLLLSATTEPQSSAVEVYRRRAE